MKVNSVTLLSEQEYETLKENIPRMECWWWLRSSRYMEDEDGNYGKYCCTDRVGSLGQIDRTPIPNKIYQSAVRPALYISDHNLKEKSKIGFGNNVWTYIGNNILLSDYIVAFSKYDDGGNHKWEECQLKHNLDIFAEKRGWINESKSP